MVAENPLVSIIVPTKDSGATIEGCLAALSSQTYEPIELLVMDAGSCDNTEDITRRYTPHFHRVPGERSEARNAGAARAKGAFLAFLDSDMYAPQGLIAECVDLARMEPSASVIMTERSVGQGFWARCRALEKECYMGDDSIEAARFFPAPLFRALGGYDPSLGPAGEDWDITFRARHFGASMARTLSEVMHDEGRLTLGKAARKKGYYGSFIPRYARRYPGQVPAQLTLLRPSLLRNYRRLLRSPTLTLGLVFLKGAEWVAFTRESRRASPLDQPGP